MPKPVCRARDALAALALATLVGCAHARGSVFDAPPPAGAALVWPAPPDTARVRWVASLARPQDIDARTSVLRRVLRLVTGGTTHEVRQPYGVAVDSAGAVYVADGIARGVHVFDTRRRRYRFLRGVGKTDFVWPVGVAVDPAGRVYVTDSRLGTLFGLDAGGKERFRTPARLARPAGVAYDRRTASVYVVESQGHRVSVFDTTGAFRFAFGERGTEPGQLNFPTNVVVDTDGSVYVTDSMNFRVQVFGGDGTYLFDFGRAGDALGDFARPKGIGLDSEGHVYVVEGLYDVVNVYDRAGRLLLTFGGAGRGVGEFWLATGLAVDARDRIYVADSFNGRVQVFQYLRAAR